MRLAWLGGVPTASSPAAGRPQALRAQETSARIPQGYSPQGGALAAAAKDRRWAAKKGGIILSQVPLIKGSAGPRSHWRPRGGTFWPLPAPGGFRRPRACGRITTASVCLHLYVASLPPGSDVHLGPSFEGPSDKSGPWITQGLPPILASFITSANTLLPRNFTFAGSRGWDPLSSGAAAGRADPAGAPQKQDPGTQGRQHHRLSMSHAL